MEKALFVSENRLVTVDEMISIYGVEKTREHVYWCEDENCRIVVRPAIPQTTKSARKRVPSPYFSRKSGSKHKNNCRSGMKKGKNPPEISEIITPDKNTISSISKIPQRFIDDLPTLIYKNKIVCKLKPGRKYKNKHGSRKRQYFFSKKTGEVKELVRFYETYPKNDLRQAPLYINNSPARTFFNAFRSVKLLSTKFSKYSDKKRFVYFGKINDFKKVDNGLIIQLQEKSGDEIPTNIFLQKCSASIEQRKELWERIKKASANPSAKIYVLGNFRHTNEGFNLAISKLNNIWVSFPEDYLNSHN